MPAFFHGRGQRAGARLGRHTGSGLHRRDQHLAAPGGHALVGDVAQQRLHLRAVGAGQRLVREEALHRIGAFGFAPGQAGAAAAGTPSTKRASIAASPRWPSITCSARRTASAPSASSGSAAARASRSSATRRGACGWVSCASSSQARRSVSGVLMGLAPLGPAPWCDRWPPTIHSGSPRPNSRAPLRQAMRRAMSGGRSPSHCRAWAIRVS